MFPPFKSSHQAPDHKIILTSSIKSRINTYLESDGLPVTEARSRQATPPPTKTHNDLAKSMKKRANQKLSDFNIKGAIQTLSGNSSFANPNEESLNTLQQNHSQAPDAGTSSICISTDQIRAAISSFPHGSGAGPDSLRPQHFTFERVHLHHSRRRQHFSPHQLNSTSLPSKWSSGNWPQAFPLWCQLHGLCKSNGDQRTIAVGYTYRCLVTSGLLETLHSKAP